MIFSISGAVFFVTWPYLMPDLTHCDGASTKNASGNKKIVRTLQQRTEMRKCRNGYQRISESSVCSVKVTTSAVA